MTTPNGAHLVDGSNNSGSGTQAITRTLAVLGVFCDDEADLGISDLAQRLSLSPSTIHRIVRALVVEGYLAQNPETERYYLARAAVLLGQAANRRLGLHLASTVLERLVDETGESVNLGVRDGSEIVVVMRAESKHPLRFSQAIGSRLPVHATSMGKSTIAYSASIEDELETLSLPLQALTPKTITSVASLRRDLERTRSRGYSTDDEEGIPSVRCVGAPILSPQGDVLAAIAIQGPAVRMPRSRLKTLAPVAVEAAQEIAELIPATRRL